MIEGKSYINTKTILFKHLHSSSALIKKLHTANIVCHILDREHDDENTFKEIDELGDEFVIRLKSKRCSHETYPTFTPSGKPSKRVAPYKLIDKVFKHGGSYQIESICIKGKTYTNVIALIEWESLQLGEKTYNVVRITLKKDGKPLFLQPMLLVTNRPIENIENAKNVYMTYLLRAKIEVVFKFLKQNLGWEDFQVRHFNSIKNLLALAFFLAGFFDELQTALQSHPIVMELCSLAHSKGKVSLHFIWEGLKKLVHFQEVRQWIQQYEITEDQIQELLDYIILK